jgi:ATP-dependent Clp protease protease subunit
MLHQVIGGAEGPAADVKIGAEHILKVRNRINKILALKSKQPLHKIEKDTDRDFFMTPQDAKKYGLIDKIIKK